MEAIRALVAELREARFSGGLRCPRCSATRVQRWGGFSGRQRYRCRGCRRTFSDFTGTPVMYSKKILHWVTYSRCLQEGLSVRRSAARSKIQPDTSFRWRHALLKELCRNERERLRGWIELGTLWFAYSEKGRKPRSREPRRRGVRRGRARQSERVRVVVAADRSGKVAAARCTDRVASARELEALLAGRIAGQPTIVAKEGRFGAAGVFARRLKGSFQDVRPGLRRGTQPEQLLAHVRTVQSFAARLEDWMARFRGVATRYLSHYLAWHGCVDRAWRQRAAARVLRWPLSDAFG
jgi:transposase-like protein